MMESSKRVLDVIVPIYNTAEYLDRCLDSILSQSFADFNIILVDDGSKDQSGEICDNYSRKYDKILAVHTKNNGLSSARNLGIQISQSAYISFIDSDDWIEKDMFKKLVTDLLTNNADIAACNMYRSISQTERREKNEITDFVDSDTLVFFDDEVLKQFYKLFSVCNKMFRRKLFDSIRFPVGKTFEDARTTYRLAYIAKIATFNRYNGYNYFQRNNGIMGTLTPELLFDKVLLWDELSKLVLSRIPSEYDYIVARKDRTILQSLFALEKNESAEALLIVRKLLNELVLPIQDNAFLSEEEKDKIITLARK